MKTKNKKIEGEAMEGAGLTILLIAFLITGIGVCSSTAQSHTPWIYKGIEATYGVRTFQIESNISEINKLTVVTEGGNVGFAYGNEIIQAKVRALGFYYATAATGRTIDLFEFEVLSNFHPFQISEHGNTSSFSPYLIGGLTQNNLKFFGNYLEKSDKKINYSDPEEPYLGKIKRSTATFGLGLEWKVKKGTHSERSYAHLFAEAKYGIPLRTLADTNAFSGTTIKNAVAINVGILIGSFR